MVQIVMINVSYRTDMPNSPKHVYQDVALLIRRFQCYSACRLSVPFGPGKNLLKI